MGRTSDIGALGERIAAEFLARKGFVILARNYRRPWGEIDIIAEFAGVVRFVEVKAISRENIGDISRESNEYRPEEQIHPAKLKKIVRTAETYMMETGDAREYQIDAVGVFMDPVQRRAQCRLFEQIL